MSPENNSTIALSIGSGQFYRRSRSSTHVPRERAEERLRWFQSTEAVSRLALLSLCYLTPCRKRKPRTCSGVARLVGRKVHIVRLRGLDQTPYSLRPYLISEASFWFCTHLFRPISPPR